MGGQKYDLSGKSAIWVTQDTLTVVLSFGEDTETGVIAVVCVLTNDFQLSPPPKQKRSIVHQVRQGC